jgi:hypothetical protein
MNENPHTNIYLLTALWHLLAAYHFTLFPTRSLARISRERPVNPIAAEAVRFLGAINVAFFGLGVGACFVDQSAYWLISLALMLANLSQALVDISVKRRGLAGGSFFNQILWGDLFFATLNAMLLVGFLLGDSTSTC